jgi:hypothetical protein
MSDISAFACKKGTYRTNDTSIIFCLNCPIGTGLETTAAKNVSECKNVSAGYYSTI